ncbi:thiamine pyrophosphate-binding protein [Synechococcus sp. BSF8S]|uniref:thiamine pyrophosphate-binding protein n=1 Tax=Synechococcales TaxID=1890424 RepID=UPI0016281F19|nr:MULTISPECIES: thiamine pyrophosphate-binding protein [unclassified Synechococcus]MBC1260304.1 thiamine pyrophosphate-binding protein [Synechococcus sp. BSF8S]MBC1263675.1 thiamine pyrophosphate-binding protein [Synechococcus sp. BSA11S]
MKYSDCLFDWLVDIGYSHCYFVAGGNIMHLLNSARQRMVCVPTVHEVAAVIAAEYHNATLDTGTAAPGVGRSLALVTAGPGLTNTITGLAGAYLESRELLLIGGQVKVQDLAPAGLRQLGIQEVDGVSLAAPVCKVSECLREPLQREPFETLVRQGMSGRRGPVFLEIPLDVQAAQFSSTEFRPAPLESSALPASSKDPPKVSADVTASLQIEDIASRICTARRPVLLIGGGVSRPCAMRLRSALASVSLPIMTTWNGADRFGSDQPNYFGRPNTWGMRYSNILIQQSDLLISVGTRLGLQQTGFNWQSFLPLGEIIQVELDPFELEKANPTVDLPIAADADLFLEALMGCQLGDHREWLGFCISVRDRLPLSEDCNLTPEGFLNPYDFALTLSQITGPEDHIVPCSSGGAFTVMMQAFEIRHDQTMLTNKGLASMGYGLAGAIGASLADPLHRTVLVEGDGGFTQNLQELATASVNKLNLKIFLFCNNGYASIRMTQKNYFDGAYLGCDISSGLGFPDWRMLAKAYGLNCYQLSSEWQGDPKFLRRWTREGPDIFLVPLHPEQTYFPKIASRVSVTGGMESNPLHRMTPELDQELNSVVLPYISAGS